MHDLLALASRHLLPILLLVVLVFAGDELRGLAQGRRPSLSVSAAVFVIIAALVFVSLNPPAH